MIASSLHVRWLLFSVLALPVSVGARPASADSPPPARRVVFEGAAAEHTWPLADLNPELPADWTGYNYLVLELKASSPQRFALSLFSGDHVQRRHVQPLPNVWIRAAVPLHYFREPNRAGHDLASIGKVPRNTFWISTRGTYGPLDAVTALGVSMQNPPGKPTLEIRSARLAREDPGSDVLDPKPVVDEFGQWMPVDWPGKVQDLAQLRRAWAAEEGDLARPGDFGTGRYGGYLSTQAKATGFFRVEKIDGRWWFVDPEGHLFFSTASTGIGSGPGESRIEGREDYFAALPPKEAASLGRRSGGFYSWNLMRRHGAGVHTQWADFALRRLDAWGFNTIGNWSDSQLWDAGRKAYQVNLSGWGMRNGYMGLPDVYSEEFVKIADRDAAAQCAPRKNDPWLLGYFIANEPPWAGRESLVVDLILERPASAIQREALAWLAAGDTPERRRQFIYRAFERFLEVTMAAIRRHDPNHLILGLRFAGRIPPEMLHACRVFDVYSLNIYSSQMDLTRLAEIHEATGRPLLIGEFHFGVPGRGLAPGLVQVRDQTERGVAYRYYVEQAAAFPGLIGTSWFQWVDQPCTGRMDGENYNIGLVDVTDRPYPELIDAVRATHRRLQAVHAGTSPPFATKPQVR
jgi:hypothetical protein